MPRSVRTKARAIERAYSKLENELRRSPDETELARDLGLTDDELARARSQMSFVGLVALDEILVAGEERQGQRCWASEVATPRVFSLS